MIRSASYFKNDFSDFGLFAYECEGILKCDPSLNGVFTYVEYIHGIHMLKIILYNLIFSTFPFWHANW